MGPSGRPATGLSPRRSKKRGIAATTRSSGELCGDRHVVVSTPGVENQPDDVPEADWAEQEVDADPLSEEAGEAETQSPNLGRGTTEANEADVAEQETGVYGEVDEYRG